MKITSMTAAAALLVGMTVANAQTPSTPMPDSQKTIETPGGAERNPDGSVGGSKVNPSPSGTTGAGTPSPNPNPANDPRDSEPAQSERVSDQSDGSLTNFSDEQELKLLPVFSLGVQRGLRHSCGPCID